MASTHSWQKATDYEALAAAHRVEGDIAAAGGPSSVDVRALIDFTKARAEADLSDMARLERITAALDNLVNDIASEHVVTLNAVQERITAAIDWAGK